MEATNHSFTKGGNQAWYHDEGLVSGVFHTYDAFRAAPWHQARKIHVFVPRDYQDSQDDGSGINEPWPTLYVHDGSGAFFANGSGSKSLRLGEILGELFGADQHRHHRQHRQPIVVAINPVDRDNEYTHERQVEDAGGSLASYSQYLVDGVVAWVQANYNVDRRACNTGIMGCSHGGLAAFYVATRYATVFGIALCFSASFWAGMDSGESTELPFLDMTYSTLMIGAHEALANVRQRPRFYIDWGTCHEGHIINSHVEALAAKRGAEVADILVHLYGYAIASELLVVIGAGHGHDEEAWHQRLPQALVWSYADPPARPSADELAHAKQCIISANQLRNARAIAEQQADGGAAASDVVAEANVCVN
jgi:predicted alpha/beta superfamily hydrolase